MFNRSVGHGEFSFQVGTLCFFSSSLSEEGTFIGMLQQFALDNNLTPSSPWRKRRFLDKGTWESESILSHFPTFDFSFSSAGLIKVTEGKKNTKRRGWTNHEKRFIGIEFFKGRAHSRLFYHWSKCCRKAVLEVIWALKYMANNTETKLDILEPGCRR